MDDQTPSQRVVSDAFANTNANLLITGDPGTGKSYWLEKAQKECERRGLRHATLASRGHAAFQVKGKTIHSRLVPLPNNSSIWKTVKEMHDCVLRASRGQLGGGAAGPRIEARRKFWTELDVLFVDEIFLADAALFCILESTARTLRDSEVPFGGLRLVLMGDPYQLAPRGDGVLPVFSALSVMAPPLPEEDEASDSDDDWDIPRAHGLMRLTFWPWNDAKLVPFELRENMRQRDADQLSFRTMLREMRGTPVSQMSDESRNLLVSRCQKDIPDDVYALFWSRADAAARNQECSEKNGGSIMATLRVRSDYEPPHGEGQDGEKEAAGANKKRLPPSGWRAELETLHDEFVNKEMPVEGKELVLREGCRYMLLANTDLEGGAFRGAVGTVVGVKAGTSGEVEDVHLKLDSQPPEAKPHVLHRRTEVLDGPSGGRCRVSFFPLGYGYAGTYDSVQGKTLEKVVCAVTPRMPAGMLYVGISRVRRAENVYIVPNVNSFNSCTDAERILLSNPGITRVDKKVARFAKELHALSCFMKYDPDVFAELKASTTQVPLPETGPPLCRMCGAAADTLAVPCGHLCACATCWDDAVLNHGLRTCFGCVRLVTGKMSVKTL